MTSELERIKILEGKISHVIDYISKLTDENEKLRHQVKELKSGLKSYEEQAKKSGKLDEEIKRYETERLALKEKIEIIINQIDQLGI